MARNGILGYPERIKTDDRPFIVAQKLENAHLAPGRQVSNSNDDPGNLTLFEVRFAA